MLLLNLLLNVCRLITSLLSWLILDLQQGVPLLDCHLGLSFSFSLYILELARIVPEETFELAGHI